MEYTLRIYLFVFVYCMMGGIAMAVTLPVSCVLSTGHRYAFTQYVMPTMPSNMYSNVSKSDSDDTNDTEAGSDKNDNGPMESTGSFIVYKHKKGKKQKNNGKSWEWNQTDPFPVSYYQNGSGIYTQLPGQAAYGMQQNGVAVAALLKKVFFSRSKQAQALSTGGSVVYTVTQKIVLPNIDTIQTVWQLQGKTCGLQKVFGINKKNTIFQIVLK
jgi:hypothetical protein